MTERKTLVFTATTLSKFLGDALLSLAYMRSRPEQVIRLLIHNGATRLHFQTRFDLFRCVCEVDPLLTMLVCKCSHENFERIRECVRHYRYFAAKVHLELKHFTSQPLALSDQIRLLIRQQQMTIDDLPPKLWNFLSFEQDL